MFRFHGGQTVEKGTYWNLSSGERVDAKTSDVLPGDRGARFVKLPAVSVFIAGPLAGLLFTCIVPFLLFFVLLSFLPRPVLASEAVDSDEAKACLGCHATPGMTKTFQDKGTLSVQIDEGHFKNTVHGFVTCTGCHSAVSLDTHPASKYGTKQEFVHTLSNACKTCHADEQIMANPLHQRVISKANAPPCSDCHGSHSIRKVPTQKEELSTSQYCLTCHRKQISLSINDQSLSLSIDEGGLQRSVHSKHSCTDCHVTYSKADHPHPQFKNVREVSLTAVEACKRCHAEKWAQHQGSVHYSLISQGNQKAPLCSDCHSAHAVGRKALAETMQGVPCRKCHADIFAAYQGSVHGKARTRGTEGAPICSSCHFAHDIKPAMASGTPKDMCLGCHANVVALHKEWLPNAEAHFDAVSCTACHVSGDYKRNVYLRVTDDSSGKRVSDAAFKGAMGKTLEENARTQGKHMEPENVWDFYRIMNKNGGKVSMSGTVSLDDAKNAHHLGPKGKAISQCEYCHTADAEFFKSVSISSVKQDGREVRYNVDSATLGSVFAMLPLGQFYALGSTRIWLIDIMGAAMIAGGIAVPVLHGAARVLTRKRRKRAAHGKGGNTL
jgi:hypothetical protein